MRLHFFSHYKAKAITLTQHDQLHRSGVGHIALGIFGFAQPFAVILQHGIGDRQTAAHLAHESIIGWP